MKKYLVIFSLIILLFVSVIYAVHSVSNIISKDYFLNQHEIHVSIINDSFPTDIILYGEDIVFCMHFEVDKIDEITEESLISQKQNQIIILSDLSGSMSISDNELLIIKEKVFSNQLDFYYLGTKELDRLYTLGFYEKPREEFDLCLSIVSSNDQLLHFNGIWTIENFDNQDDLSKALINQFIKVIIFNQSN
jgi:uncharacterized membrane protein YciS (DUF1049 family)